MQTILLLIRHGDSTWNREGRVQGWLDPPHSEHRLGGIQGLTSDEIASKFPHLHVFHFDSTSITRVRLRRALVQVMALNDGSHLQELTAPVDLQSHW